MSQRLDDNIIHWILFLIVIAVMYAVLYQLNQ